MKKNIIILSAIISLIFTDPFKEFDKDFLYTNSLGKSEWSELAKTDLISICVNSLDEKTETYNNRKEFCDCTLNELMSVFSQDEFVSEMSYIEKNKIVSTNLNKALLTKEPCLTDFVSELMISMNKTQDSFGNQSKNKDTSKASKKKDKNSFEEKIKDLTKIEGLLTFYVNNDENKALIEIHPDQLNKTYLLSITRQSGDAYYFDGSSMQGEFPIMFKKVGNKLQLIEVNVKFRADQNLPINKAVKNHISNSIVASGKILSKPNEETGSILVNASDFFITDIGNLTMIKSGGYKFDKSNSYYNHLKSFPNNSEIDVSIHYISTKPKYKFTLADSKSMIHKYHISISTIPDTNYKPRLADDRVGHFMTMYQDYSDTYKDSPYVRYINRWRLKKKNPNANMSEPVEPIVFWIENTIPTEFRAAVEEGILKWNLSFEKIGFKNAIVAKQMPDDADWDPADIRYNTIRWMIQPGSAYAVGPSRANPFTGELYDADIRIGSDFLRFFYTDFIEYIDPLDLMAYEDSMYNHSHKDCQYHNIMKHKMNYAWNYLTASGKLENNPENMKKFVHDGIVDLILHEVGHTLGLRHNFKASSVFSIEQLSDPDFTEEYGITGSVMDYNATNLLDGGENYFQIIPGPYDDWAIEYAYSEQSRYSTVREEDFLNNIASKSIEPLLTYGTDEDAGSSSIDPYSNRRDMTAEPIKHYIKRIELGNSFIDDLLENFEKDGERYPRIRNIFFQGFYEYYGAVRSVSKFIGGIKHSRHHVGQEYKDNPLKTVDIELQNEALNFYKDYIFDKNAFKYSPELLNKMAPERLGDFEGSVWDMNRLDFPLHSIVGGVQRLALSRLFDYKIHNRIIDNKLKSESEDIFELDYLFNEISSSIWEELDAKENISSFRRQLQIMHINYLTKVYLDENNKFPYDSESLSRLHLGNISNKIDYVLKDQKNLDDYTVAHLLKSEDIINEILDKE